MRVALVVTIAVAATVAPTAATAATLTGGIVYRADPGEVNRLQVGREFALFSIPVTEFQAPLKIGAGCVPGTPIVCTGSGADVHLGDMNDIASVAPFFEDAHVFAGPGDDDVLASGQSVSASGEAGNDIIRVDANGTARADGGPGDDEIGGVVGVDQFDGGAGNDLLVPVAQTPAAVAQGGPGNDVLVAASRPGFSSIVAAAQSSFELTGDNGDDVITALPGTRLDVWPFTFDGGRGDDVLSGPARTVDSGPGDDLIDVVGGSIPSTVSCGGGFDVVWTDGSDVLGADCERRIQTATPPALPGVANAIARAQALLSHQPQPDPSAT